MKKYVFNNAHIKLKSIDEKFTETDIYEIFYVSLLAIGAMVFSLNFLAIEFSTSYVLYLNENMQNYSITSLIYNNINSSLANFYEIDSENSYILKEDTVKFVSTFLLGVYGALCLLGYAINVIIKNKNE